MKSFFCIKPTFSLCEFDVNNPTILRRICDRKDGIDSFICLSRLHLKSVYAYALIFWTHFGWRFLAHSAGTVPYTIILNVPGFARVAR